MTVIGFTPDSDGSATVTGFTPDADQSATVVGFTPDNIQQAAAPAATYPDVRAAIAARGGPGGRPYTFNPPEQALPSMGDVGMAMLHGAGELAQGVVGSMAPLVTGTDPARSIADAGIAAAREYASSPGAAGKVRAALSAVPFVGPIASEALQPSLAVAQNRAPTPQENLAPVSAGTQLLGMAAMGAAGGGEGPAEGAPVSPAEAAPVAAPVATELPAPVQVPVPAPSPGAWDAVGGGEQPVYGAPPAPWDVVGGGEQPVYSATPVPSLGASRPLTSEEVGGNPTSEQMLSASNIQKLNPGLSYEDALAEAGFDGKQGAQGSEQNGPYQDTAKPEIVAPDQSGEAAKSPVMLPIDFRAQMPESSAADYGEAVRTATVGVQNASIDQAVSVAKDGERLVPNPVDRQALAIYRDFKSDPGRLQTFLDGTAEPYTKLPPAQREAMLGYMRQKLGPIIERAMSPTPQMLQYDGLMTDYARGVLGDGTNLGIFHSSIDPEQYAPHMFSPSGLAPEDTSPGHGGGGLSRSTPFSEQRYYPTVLDAIVSGAEPKTLDPSVTLPIYGDKFGAAKGARMLMNTLRDSGIGKFSTRELAPVDWENMAPHSRAFSNDVPFIDSEGNPQVAHQDFYAPKPIAEALRPLTDPNFLDQIPGFRTSQIYQTYIKTVELGLALFHPRALNITALGNMGIEGLARSYDADIDSSTFRFGKQILLRAGGEVSTTGHTAEAYRAANPGLTPTTLERFRSLPGVKQLDQGLAATSTFTFDNIQQRFKVTDFGIQNARWIAKHPNATAAELYAAQRSIAKEVNAGYGGVNWLALGINRMTQSLLHATFMAPDWTFSNWLNLKYTFQGGPGGAAARMFWVRSAVTGVALSQMTSKLLTGQFSDDPTSVYLGKDNNGKKVYMNAFFAGAPQEAINLIKNSVSLGPIAGPAKSLGGKLSPFVRTGIDLVKNTNYYTQPIVPRGAGPLASTLLAGRYGTAGVAPVPFMAQNLLSMIDRPPGQSQPLPIEKFLTPLTGVRARHVSPDTENYFTQRGLQHSNIMGPREEMESLSTPEGRSKLAKELADIVRGRTKVKQ